MAGEPVNVNEFQELARKALPKMYYDFYAGGADDQHTLKDNIEAFHRIIIRPRILIDVGRIDMSATILGHKTSAPIMIGPTGMHKLAHPEGEIATARAAGACNIIMGMSFSSTCTIDEVASSCDAVRFFQAYVFKKRYVTELMVQRAERNGFKALIVTVDTPRLGRREADIKNKFIPPQLKNFKGLISTSIVPESGSGLEAYASSTLDSSFNWKQSVHAILDAIFTMGHPETVSMCFSTGDIAWLKSITTLPILLKGILTHEDGHKRALEVGVAGIIVSNHGARQLDYSPPSISVLEENLGLAPLSMPMGASKGPTRVRTLTYFGSCCGGGKDSVLFDGGVRRGTDIFKALALGAQAVLIGRPVIFGLAVKGEKGVKCVLEMLKGELELTMALSGCCTLKDITRAHVKTESESLVCRL